MRYMLGVVALMVVVMSVNLSYAATAEPGEYLDRRTEIWNLFFRMMVVAITIGAVVSGTLIWLIWRFRESNPKAKPTEFEGTDW